MKRCIFVSMNQVSGTYHIWIGGPCDYGHKERAGAASAVIELDGKVNDRKQIASLHTTEFRMMLTLMIQLMNETGPLQINLFGFSKLKQLW